MSDSMEATGPSAGRDAAGGSAPPASGGRRRGRRYVAVRLLGGLVAAVVAVVVYALFFSAPLVERYALPYGSAALSGSGFSLAADWVKGRPARGFTFGNFRITYTGGDEPVTVFRAESLSVEYDLTRLLRKEWRIERVRIACPEITLIRPPQGGVLLPGLVGGKPRKRGGGPTVDIRRIDLAGAVLRISKKTGEERFEDMDLTCSYLRDPHKTLIGLRRASFRMPGRNFTVSRTSAALTLSKGVLYLEDGVAELIGSVIDFEGSISFRDGVRYDIECEGRPYDVPELAAILQQKWPEGLLEGPAHVRGPADSLAITARVSGNVERFTLDEVSVECLRKGERFTFSKVLGRVNGADIDAAGSLGGGALAFDIDFAGLDAAAGFFPGVAFPETRLAGVAHVRHAGAGSDWTVEASMSGGHVARFEFATLYYRGEIGRGRVTLDSVRVARPGMEALARGEIGLGPGGQIAVDFEASLDSVGYAASWLGVGQLEGALRAEGRLSGPSSDPVLEAHGPLAEVGRGVLRVRGGAFSALVDGLKDHGPVRFELEGGDVCAGSSRVGSLELAGIYDRGRLFVPRFVVARGDSSVEGSFTMNVRDGETIARFDTLAVSLNGRLWASDHPFDMSYKNAVYSLQGLRLSCGGGAVTLSGRLDRGRGGVEINAAATGVRITSVPLPRGRVEGGVVSGEVFLSGPLSGPAGSGHLRWIGARAFGRDLSEASVNWSLSEGGLEIQRFRVDLGESQTSVTGQIDLKPDLTPLLEGRPRAFLEDATRAPVDLSFSVTGFDLSLLRDLAFPEAVLAGALTVSGTGRGTLGEPVLDLDLRGKDVAVNKLAVDSVHGSFEYAEGRVRASGVRVRRGEVTASIEGYLPLRVGVPGGVRIDRAEAMALHVEVSPGDFGVVADVWDGLASSSGRFFVDATLTGTPSSPSLSGSGWLEDCSLRLAGTEEEFRDIDCKYVLSGDMIEIERVSGKEGESGSFTASGEITLSWPGVSDYNFDVVFERMAVLTPMDYDAIVSGEVIVSAYALEGGKLIPQVAGRVVVDEAAYSGTIGGASKLRAGGGASGTVMPGWLADLELEIPGTARITNADADLVFAGDIALIKDFDGIKPRGELRVVSGSYYLMSTEFRVTSGTITFGEAVGVDPDLDITAETVLGSAETGLEERIYVHLTGTASEPRITVSSTSGYSETEIYNMLLAGTLWGQGPQEAGGPDISTLATNTLFNAIDARLRELFGARPPVTIGLTREKVNPEEPGPPETRISVGRSLSSRLFLQYEQGFSTITRREVNLDYRVNKYLLLRSQIINNPQRGIREESSSEINFDLKLRYEF